MIRITFLDGETIDVTNKTVLVGLNNAPRTEKPNEQMFYLSQDYIGNLWGDYEEGGSALSTSDERLGIAGFLLSHDLFAIDEGEDQTMYFTSAIKSISVI